MRRDLVKALRVCALAFAPFAAAAVVAAKCGRRAVDNTDPALHGTYSAGFYDFGGGWYAPAVLLTFIGLFAVSTLLLMPRRRR